MPSNYFVPTRGKNMNNERQKMEKRFDLSRRRIGQFVLQSNGKVWREENVSTAHSLYRCQMSAIDLSWDLDLIFSSHLKSSVLLLLH